MKTQRYTNMKLMILLCLIFQIGAVVGQSIVKPPTDTTGTIGGTAKFVCEVDYGENLPTMIFKFYNEIIYSYFDEKVNYPLGTNKYVVSNTHTNFTLEVRDLNYKDGGNYICQVIGQEKSAALIVLGLPAITQETTNLIEGSTAIFTCEERFGGPRTDTTSLDIQVQLVLDDTTYEEKLYIKNDAFYRKVYEIAIEDIMDTKELKCVTRTKSKHLTSSIQLNVLYSVHNITYSPQYDKYEIGSNITCSARGNPFPWFEWRNHEYTTFKGQLLHITNDMEGKNSWTCTARNYVDGKIYEDEITANFEAASHVDKKIFVKLSYGLIGAGVGCFVGIIGLSGYQKIKGRSERIQMKLLKLKSSTSRKKSTKGTESKQSVELKSLPSQKKLKGSTSRKKSTKGTDPEKSEELKSSTSRRKLKGSSFRKKSTKGTESKESKEMLKGSTSRKKSTKGTESKESEEMLKGSTSKKKSTKGTESEKSEEMLNGSTSAEQSTEGTESEESEELKGATSQKKLKGATSQKKLKGATSQKKLKGSTARKKSTKGPESKESEEMSTEGTESGESEEMLDSSTSPEQSTEGTESEESEKSTKGTESGESEEMLNGSTSQEQSTEGTESEESEEHENSVKFYLENEVNEKVQRVP